eukprot:6086412-Amphidinium_carterae.1
MILRTNKQRLEQGKKRHRNKGRVGLLSSASVSSHWRSAMRRFHQDGQASGERCMSWSNPGTHSSSAWPTRSDVLLAIKVP